MRLIPSIGSIFKTSSLTLLFFTIGIFIVAFIHASSSPSTAQISQLFKDFGAPQYSSYSGLVVTFLEAQSWPAYATFGIPAAFGVGLPSIFLYYITALVASFLAALIALRKESRVIDSILAPLLCAFKITVGLFVLGIVSGLIFQQVGQSLASNANVPEFVSAMFKNMNLTQAYTVSAWILVLIVTYVFFLLGALPVALFREFALKKRGGVPVKAEAPAEEEQEEPAEEEEQAEEEEEAEGVACPECGELNEQGARFCASCGASMRPKPKAKPVKKKR